MLWLTVVREECWVAVGVCLCRCWRVRGCLGLCEILGCWLFADARLRLTVYGVGRLLIEFV